VVVLVGLGMGKELGCSGSLVVWREVEGVQSRSGEGYVVWVERLWAWPVSALFIYCTASGKQRANSLEHARLGRHGTCAVRAREYA